MIKNLWRQQRVAHEIQKEITMILHRKLNDPRVEMLTTVSGVEISSDLAYAKVFITFPNSYRENEAEDGIETLQKAAGFIRILLGQAMQLRIVPKLTFFHDNSLVEGVRISRLVTNLINKRDKEYHVKIDKVIY